MKASHDRKRRFGTLAMAGVILASLLAVSFQSLTFAQESTETTISRDKEMDSKPMCPMMAGLKGIKLTADSPPLLMARADELNLTAQQKQELKSIAEEAQRKAAKVLTADQQSMLGESPSEAKSMMEIAMMRSKETKSDKSGEMCPMCKKKMEGMMKKMMSREDSRRGDETNPE